jgi:hypothetical protein
MDSRMAGDGPNSAAHRAPRLAECEARLAACAAELRRRAGDADALLARSTAQLRECQRLAAIVAQHERAGSVLQAAVRQLREENARLSDRLASRDGEALALEARIKTHEAEYRRMTRLVAERAREIFELKLVLGTRGSVTPRGSK